MRSVNLRQSNISTLITTAMRSHNFCDLGAAEPDRQTKWGFTVFSSSIGIRTVREQPFHRVDNRGVSEQRTSVKERGAILFADYIYIDTSPQRQLRQFNRDLSEIRLGLVRISTGRCICAKNDK
jgi:hypothetical protein